MKRSVISTAVCGVAASLLVACSSSNHQAEQVTPKNIVNNYASIAEAIYGDSLITAKQLKEAINVFLATPTEDNLAKAKAAWVESRVPYQQSEAYRFGNAIVDDWEGKVNAWPLDEGLIDYVDADYGTESDANSLYTANVIGSKSLTINGSKLNITDITSSLLQELHEADGVEANVATGYHAIEFLLWGQDLNGTNPGAGNRPASDFDVSNCTNGNCDRRRDYLVAATDLLISDLEEMVANWGTQGAARQAVLQQSDKQGLATILTGMGSLAYGELGGERTKLGLMLHDPEEEHDCFSDNTHYSHYYDAKGIENVYLGEYQRIDGSWVKGPSLSALVKSQDSSLDTTMKKKLKMTDKTAQAMVDAAKKGQTFDVLIGMGNTDGNQLVQDFVDSLVDETRTIEDIIGLLDLANVDLEGSDSLDNPASVFQ